MPGFSDGAGDGAGDGALAGVSSTGAVTTTPITPAMVKQRLVGLGPWLDAAAALAAPYTYDDTAIQTVIDARIREFERETQYVINPVQYWTTPDGTNPTGTDPVTGLAYSNIIVEDPYDYFVKDSREYFRIMLRHRPIIEVQRVRVMFGTMTVYSIPPQWYQVKNRAGIFHVITQFGSLAIASAMAGYALLGMGLSDKSYMPNALAIDYVAGLPSNWQTLYEWQDLVKAVTEYCALQVLLDVAYLADAGLASVNTGGASTSESRNYDRFEKRKAELQASIDRFKATLADDQQPIVMAWV